MELPEVSAADRCLKEEAGFDEASKRRRGDALP